MTSCHRSSDGCTDLAGHNGDCFGDEYIRHYTLMLAAEATDEQIGQLLEPFTQEHGGEDVLSPYRYPDGEIGTNFRGHEDPHKVRDQVAARLADWPVPVTVAYLVYDVADVAADVRLDIPIGVR